MINVWKTLRSKNSELPLFDIPIFFCCETTNGIKVLSGKYTESGVKIVQNIQDAFTVLQYLGWIQLSDDLSNDEKTLLLGKIPHDIIDNVHI